MSLSSNRFTMMAEMDRSKLDVIQLKRRDPVAWTALLNEVLGSDEIAVTAVGAVPLHPAPHEKYDYPVLRYILTLADHSDPISFIGKCTNKSEVRFYQKIASEVPDLAPRCLFADLSGEDGWVVLDDVPRHYLPHQWTLPNVESLLHGLTDLHAVFWDQRAKLQRKGLHHFIGQQRYDWDQLIKGREILFEQGPAAVISGHAINSAGRLAPLLLEAANGLAIIRNLGGWPGILGETQMAAAADLLDDPLPMLEPLRNLPPTLVHGNPFNYHWRLTLFDDLRLLDWRKAVIGPGIYDLVHFIEKFDLLYHESSQSTYTRQEWPVSEETMVDSYLLSMSGRLGSKFDARAVRQAIPAARCLHILINWFPYFAKWFSEMPNKYTWQKVNRMSDAQLEGTIFEPVIGYRPHLAAVFGRFLRAYRTL